jgi:hypothetical protein
VLSRIVTVLSRLLDPAERECVCGDLEELRLRVPKAVANILGLVIRRQLAEWSQWGPWIALLGVAVIAGPFLSEFFARVQTGLFLQIRTYFVYRVAYEPGGVSVAQQITYSAASMIAVLLCTWACGYALAALSGRALWMTAFLFYCVIQDAWAVRMAVAGNIILKHGLAATMLLRLLPIQPVMLVFLLAVGLGIRSARKGRLQRNTRLLLAAAGVAQVLLLARMETWFAVGFAHWSGQAYVPAPLLYRVLPLIAGAWPIFALPLLKRRSVHGRTA